MTMLDPPRVLLVDDNQDILDRAVAMLADGCKIVGTAMDGPGALAAVEALSPDVVVLDISLPGMSGLEVADRLRYRTSPVAIVFLTIHDDQEVVDAAQAVGGIGYVVKTRLPLDLPVAVTEARAGRRYVSKLR
jgi:DNA-binding NarL/FixJ family response regulator